MTTATLPATAPPPSSAASDVAYFANRNSFAMDAGWEPLVDQLLRVYTLEDDWDGAGAAAPDKRCIEAALNWIREMAKSSETAVPPSYVSVSPGGELLLAWQTDSEYLEAEVVSPTEVEWMYCVDGSPTENWISGVEGTVQRR